jgi:hypothetical protein
MEPLPSLIPPCQIADPRRLIFTIVLLRFSHC